MRESSQSKGPTEFAMSTLPQLNQYFVDVLYTAVRICAIGDMLREKIWIRNTRSAISQYFIVMSPLEIGWRRACFTVMWKMRSFRQTIASMGPCKQRQYRYQGNRSPVPKYVGKFPVK